MGGISLSQFHVLKTSIITHMYFKPNILLGTNMSKY